VCLLVDCQQHSECRVEDDTFVPFVVYMIYAGKLSLLFSNTMYHWTAAFVSPLMISYRDFLILFLHVVRCFLLYTSCLPEALYA
jgi:hypothetical protein